MCRLATSHPGLLDDEEQSAERWALLTQRWHRREGLASTRHSAQRTVFSRVVSGEAD